jgi:hypothetical protein
MVKLVLFGVFAELILEKSMFFIMILIAQKWFLLVNLLKIRELLFNVMKNYKI